MCLAKSISLGFENNRPLSRGGYFVSGDLKSFVYVTWDPSPPPPPGRALSTASLVERTRLAVHKQSSIKIACPQTAPVQ